MINDDMVDKEGTSTDYVPRWLDLGDALRKKSHFLLGPRQTGKSLYLRTQLPKTLTYSLLQSET